MAEHRRLQRSLSAGVGDGARRISTSFASVLIGLLLAKKNDEGPSDSLDEPTERGGGGGEEETDGAGATGGGGEKDEAFRQACLNALVLVFVFITGCIAVSVFYVLQPFLHALLWAILTGGCVSITCILVEGERRLLSLLIGMQKNCLLLTMVFHMSLFTQLQR